MKQGALCLGLLLFAGCTAAPPSSPPPSSPIQPEGMLEQVPAELSLAHFAQMRLSGTGLTLAAVLADEPAYTRYSVTYLSNGLTISGVMNIPKGDGPFPLVILNHGYIAPSVYTSGRGLRREQDYLARRGFAVLHPDYRGYASSDPSPDERQVYDASLEYSMDSANAINAVRNADLPAVDAGRVGMLGHSLGGGIALNIAVARPELVDAIILYAPVHSDAWENFHRWRSEREEGDRTRAVLGTREENPAAWDALSSLTHLASIDDPILLFHGTEDASVPQDWSDFLAQRLREFEQDISYVVYAGETHEFIPQWGDFMRRSAAFLHEHLTEETWLPPVSDAQQRVTKKPFGIAVTPQDSPVQPERFSGHHTGVDFELLPGEDEGSVPVHAACTGEVIFRDWVKGYGGVVVQRCVWNGEPVTALYGHLSLSSVEPSSADMLRAGDRIGHLGAGWTEETDGERPHLHFAVHRGASLELRGYAEDVSQLEAWLDPLRLFR